MNPRFLTSFTTNYDVTMSPPSVCVLATASDDWLRDLTLSITKCPTLGIDIRKTWFCLLNRYTYILKTCKSRHCFNSCTKFKQIDPFPHPFLLNLGDSLSKAFNGFLKHSHYCFRSEIRLKSKEEVWMVEKLFIRSLIRFLIWCIWL